MKLRGGNPNQSFAYRGGTLTQTIQEQPGTEIVEQAADFDWETIQDQVARQARQWAENRDLKVREVQPRGSHAFELHIEDVEFPDNTGQGRVVVQGARVLGQGRIRIELEHNRVFASQGRRLFLNDYLFIAEFEPGQTPNDTKLRQGFKAINDSIRGLASTRERVLDGQARLAKKTLVARGEGEISSYRDHAQVEG